MSIVAAIIDVREPEFIKKLTFGGIPTVVSRLDYGDIHVACDDGSLLCIERKTPEDFLGSLKDDRLFAQVARMKKQSKWAYVMITGQFERTRDGMVMTDQRVTGWTWQSVEGAILSIQECGCYVVHCAGDSDFENAIIRLANRSRAEVMLIPASKTAKQINGAMSVLTAFPGIGIDTAQKIFEYTGSLAWALVGITDGDNVPGVGPVTRKLMRRVLGLEDDMELAIQVKSKGEQNVSTSNT